jgi:mannose-1-phosphate guanylyltransferase
MIHAVIMAGGIGSRFWPLSRRDRPKQFISLLDESTLIQNTSSRLEGIVPADKRYVVTNERYVEQTRAQLPALPEENIMAEPIGRNTAPCITYAAMKIHEQDPDAIMIVLPADHVISDVGRFHRVLEVGIEAARERGALVTIGIEPTYPATGYGYIQFDPEDDGVSDEPRSRYVKTFAEKPNLATAERFLDSGDFLWNSGMFIWRAEAILDAVQRHLPDVYEAFLPYHDVIGTSEERSTLERIFRSCPSISIDYGVMERADKVYVVPGSFGWSDVGDWRAVYDLAEKNEHGNSIQGNAILHDSSRCLIQAGDRLVALVGVHDMIVVDTEDALLVCQRDSTQRVKNVVDYLYSHQLDAYV